MKFRIAASIVVIAITVIMAVLFGGSSGNSVSAPASSNPDFGSNAINGMRSQ